MIRREDLHRSATAGYDRARDNNSLVVQGVKREVLLILNLLGQLDVASQLVNLVLEVCVDVRDIVVLDKFQDFVNFLPSLLSRHDSKRDILLLQGSLELLQTVQNEICARRARPMPLHILRREQIHRDQTARTLLRFLRGRM